MNNIKKGDKVFYQCPTVGNNKRLVTAKVLRISKGTNPIITLNNYHQAKWNGSAYELLDMPYCTLEKQ